jgi:hypothetical protein
VGKQVQVEIALEGKPRDFKEMFALVLGECFPHLEVITPEQRFGRYLVQDGACVLLSAILLNFAKPKQMALQVTVPDLGDEQSARVGYTFFRMLLFSFVAEGSLGTILNSMMLCQEWIARAQGGSDNRTALPTWQPRALPAQQRNLPKPRAEDLGPAEQEELRFAIQYHSAPHGAKRELEREQGRGASYGRRIVRKYLERGFSFE